MTTGGRDQFTMPPASTGASAAPAMVAAFLRDLADDVQRATP
jgi:hypothetical protein